MITKLLLAGRTDRQALKPNLETMFESVVIRLRIRFFWEDAAVLGDPWTSLSGIISIRLVGIKLLFLSVWEKSWVVRILPFCLSFASRVFCAAAALTVPNNFLTFAKSLWQSTGCKQEMDQKTAKQVRDEQRCVVMRRGWGRVRGRERGSVAHRWGTI